MPTYFSDQIFWPDTEGDPPKFNPGKLYGFAKKKDIFMYKKIIFPINLKHYHWFHIVTERRSTNMQHPQPKYRYDVVYRDSMQEKKTRQKWVPIIGKYLLHVYMKYYQVAIVGDTLLGEEVIEDFPQQVNSDDCGVFTGIGMNYEMLDKMVIFRQSVSQNEMPLLRAHIARSIITGQVNADIPELQELRFSALTAGASNPPNVTSNESRVRETASAIITTPAPSRKADVNVATVDSSDTLNQKILDTISPSLSFSGSIPTCTSTTLQRMASGFSFNTATPLKRQSTTEDERPRTISYKNDSVGSLLFRDNDNPCNILSSQKKKKKEMIADPLDGSETHKSFQNNRAKRPLPLCNKIDFQIIDHLKIGMESEYEVDVNCPFSIDPCLSPNDDNLLELLQEKVESNQAPMIFCNESANHYATIANQGILAVGRDPKKAV
jgi:hypothetical protein